MEKFGFASDSALRCGFWLVESAVEGWGFLQRGRLSALTADRVVDSTPQLPDLLGELGVVVEACFHAP